MKLTDTAVAAGIVDHYIEIIDGSPMIERGRCRGGVVCDSGRTDPLIGAVVDFGHPSHRALAIRHLFRWETIDVGSILIATFATRQDRRQEPEKEYAVID